jgi:uncharacterized protein (TIGR03000 family)
MSRRLVFAAALAATGALGAVAPAAPPPGHAGRAPSGARPGPAPAGARPAAPPAGARPVAPPGGARPGGPPAGARPAAPPAGARPGGYHGGYYGGYHGGYGYHNHGYYPGYYRPFYGYPYWYGYPYGYGYPGFGLSIGIGRGLGVVSPYYYGLYGYGGYAPYLGSGAYYSAGVPYAIAPLSGSYQSFYTPQVPAADVAGEPPLATGGAARLAVRVPPNARLWVDDYQTRQTGPVREFTTPANLEPGRTYNYTLRAEWEENGRTVTQTRTVEFQAGSQLAVDMTQPAPAPQPSNRAGIGRMGA